ncbi:E3 ubiquitin-protein ligase TRAIP [Corythoichthys intestinalis]|uniref:E3 ubiquitin-protein ligase TRAIP n=1 Tax=Corythoichthys intestinalis TaxID=161448 RepID=UPI0025A57DB0|nr:E3 ubiquitin-protein ligase TRAIP [Corythoichthys intestinalis]XP_057701665.1 E3 ubiquitin-protein ligase TRAIP [Corythoichthys intestinalis]XP_061814601.1 E3 ubiquitin-protein ligase TRAIP-like [Nerophis lumbriciformis]
MPIRAYCIICCDFFDHVKDVAAIPCGHTFHNDCLTRWFQTGPTKTCPQCRQQVSTRHIITKLFFDMGGEEPQSADPESMANELNKLRALLNSKEKDCRSKQRTVDELKDSLDMQRKELDSKKKEVSEKDMLCSALRKQMTYLETRHDDVQAAKDEARRLRTKVKTFENLDVLLQGQRAEVESMITDMGVSPAAVEQLSIYCISLKKEYDTLKGSLKSSNDVSERLRRELLSANNKLQKASAEASQTKEDMKSLQNDLANADKEISSLKKKVEFLQKSLSTPTRTNEVLNRIIFESPAPVVLKPHLHQPVDGDEVDLNLTYEVNTPDASAKRPVKIPTKKMRVDEPSLVPKHNDKASTSSKARVEDSAMDPFLRNSLLFRKKTFGSMLEPQRTFGNVKSGYDGLGGRTKFIQPSPLAEIRPLIKMRRKKVSRPPATKTPCMTMDSFLE